MEEIIKVPLDRIKAFIGENGETKKMLEEKCNLKLQINDDGELHLIGETADIYFSKNVILAIARGFSPPVALKMLDHTFDFHIYHLKEYGASENDIKRLQGRIIGENGKMKLEMEEAGDCYISVYGNTVTIIGKADAMRYVKEAIEMLLAGSMHTSVFRYLNGVKRKLFEERLRGS